jgi:ubiquinone/menaquinone biosynthesis C-methylase UbiE
MGYTLAAEAAETYERLFVPALFGPWARRAVELPAVASARSLLDVACGTGVVARAAADRLGAGCAVTGLDANPAMLAVAARLRPDLSWVEGGAEALPFGDGRFDVVTSQAALMFFDDRVAALREMGRVAGHGAVVVQVPGRLHRSAGYRALADAVAGHAGPAVVELLTSYFSVGEPELLEALFAAAGLRIDQFTSRPDATRLDSVETLLAVELLPLADAVTPEVRERIVASCREAMRPFTEAGGAVAAPIEAHLIVARPAAP